MQRRNSRASCLKGIASVAIFAAQQPIQPMIVSLAKSALRPAAAYLDDNRYYIEGTPPPSRLTRCARTLRYRLAAKGIPLTRNEYRLLQFRNRHAGERCFIMGNGPSLNLCDLSLLRDEITFGFNSIFLNREKMGYAPTYYVVEDVLVAEDRQKEINSFVGPRQKFFGNYLRCFLQDSPEVIWTNVQVRYDEYPGWPHFGKDAARELWCGGTVSYLALQLAYYMGFQEIYMVGFDHRYQVPKDVQMDGKRWTSTSADPNHFHPDYFGKGYRWHDPRTGHMEMGFQQARRAFDAAGRQVYNATVGGHLEVFPRVDFKQLFPRRSPAASGVV